MSFWLIHHFQSNQMHFFLPQVVFQMPTSRLKSKALHPQPWSAATMTSSIRYVARQTFSLMFILSWCLKDKAWFKILSLLSFLMACNLMEAWSWLFILYWSHMHAMQYRVLFWGNIHCIKPPPNQTIYVKHMCFLTAPIYDGKAILLMPTTLEADV